jgi:hypothetical protein
MTAMIFGRRRNVRKLSINVIVGLALLVLGLGYIYFLKFEDASAVADLTTLRQNDPMKYLEDVRHRKGFDAYLAQFSNSYGYDHFTRDVPPFLLGRWALFDQPQRVGYQYIAENCINFLAIEDGEIRAKGKFQADYPARYRIAQSTVEADIGDGRIVPISLVSYGMDLHHIVVTLPDRPKPLYGYLCK